LEKNKLLSKNEVVENVSVLYQLQKIFNQGVAGISEKNW
jgi:hypothetical protein